MLRQGPGYLLRVEAERIDTVRFQRLAHRGHELLAAGEPEGAVRLLTEALGLWRGRALADLAVAPFAQVEATRQQELRLAAVDQAILRHDLPASILPMAVHPGGTVRARRGHPR